MAKFVFGMNQSLDGYVDHLAFGPTRRLFAHFVEQARGQTGSVYGRTLYEVMRYWDEDQPDWEELEFAYAAAWRQQPKWVVSSTLDAVGPNATLIRDNLESAMRRLKTDLDGEIQIGGPELAQSLAELCLIDEFRIYLHPVVLGHGKAFFRGPRPRLRLVTTNRVDEDVLQLSYVPA